MKRATIPIAGVIFATILSTSSAAPIVPLPDSDRRAITKAYYYRPYYGSYRPYYRPYYNNPHYIPYYYYGCRRFYSWGYLRCIW